MNFLAKTPVDRYAGAHEHFSSSGLDIKKVILILVGLAIFSFLIYYAVKDDDKNNDKDS